MQSAILTNRAFPSIASTPAPIKGLLPRFFADLGHEISHELQFDTSESDSFVRNHIGGMVIAMFSLIVLFVVVSVGVVALFHNY
jgi:hypothetical protein